jgi:S-adenosylmethionine-diacylgycerolhomoserine-N-methlytransferase
MSFFSDLQVLYHLALKPIRGESHEERLESFYSGQADAYDDFRRRLLQGRQELWDTIDPPEDAVWVDMGGGTGANLEWFGDKLAKLRHVYIVDLAPSLLAVAQKRIDEQGWTNVSTVHADATQWQPPEGPADVVTFSYSLTMIPDWFAAIDNARRMLRAGGQIGVVDFFVSRKYPSDDQTQHSWFSRNFWPVWFGSDNVFPSPDHLPYLRRAFDTVHLSEHYASVPYLFFLSTPYYRFVGRKREE